MQILGMSDNFKKGLACLAMAFAVAADLEWNAYDVFERPDGSNALAEVDPSCRHLTSGEIALARSVFGDAIDYTHIKIFNRPYMMVTGGHCGGMAPNGSIYVPEPGHRCDDYSAAPSHAQGFFLHEMTHVWQHQNGRDVRLEALCAWISRYFDYQATYPYELHDHTGFSDLCLEQQADAAKDYAALRRTAEALRDSVQASGRDLRTWTAEDWRNWSGTHELGSMAVPYDAQSQWDECQWQEWQARLEGRIALYEKTLQPLLGVPALIPPVLPQGFPDSTMIADTVPPPHLPSNLPAP